MMSKSTQTRFCDYRYYKPHTHYSPKIALKIDVNHDSETLIFSFAVCSADDNFSKDIARKITDDRMKDMCVLGGQYDREETLVENCRAIAIAYLDSFDLRYPKGSEGADKFRSLRQLTNTLVAAFCEIDMNKTIERIESSLDRLNHPPIIHQVQ